MIAWVRRQPSGLYLVRDSDGETHATRSAWLATLATRYHEAQTPVSIHSVRGWYYRELQAIMPAETVATC
jgi:hypothetical protein